jgi:hypothetical protein
MHTLKNYNQMRNIKSLTEDRRLHEKLSSGKSKEQNILKLLTLTSKCHIYTDVNTFEISKYIFSFNEKQSFSIMDCISSTELSIWIKTRLGYMLFPFNNLEWLHAPEAERESSKIAYQLWDIIEKNPELKAKICQIEGDQKYLDPFPITNLPYDLQDKLLALGTLQSQMDAGYNPINIDKFPNYSIILRTSPRKGSLKGYGWDFFETSGNSTQTISNASISNIYESQKKLDDFIQQNSNNIYKSKIKPINIKKRKELYNSLQLSISKLKINYLVKNIKPSDLAKKIFEDHKFDFFIRDAEDPLLADINLYGCNLENFLDCAFPNAWSISSDGIITIGLPYPGPELPPQSPICQIKYHDPPEEEPIRLPMPKRRGILPGGR